MTTSVDHNMATNVGIHMTTIVAIDMTTHVGIGPHGPNGTMTTNVVIDMILHGFQLFLLPLYDLYGFHMNLYGLLMILCGFHVIS